MCGCFLKGPCTSSCLLAPSTPTPPGFTRQQNERLSSAAVSSVNGVVRLELDRSLPIRRIHCSYHMTLVGPNSKRPASTWERGGETPVLPPSGPCCAVDGNRIGGFVLLPLSAGGSVLLRPLDSQIRNPNSTKFRTFSRSCRSVINCAAPSSQISTDFGRHGRWLFPFHSAWESPMPMSESA